ncbi:MAG: 1-deoxy-D-xylulose-5-phosphate reductoisomerase [Bacilli bacterium]
MKGISLLGATGSIGTQTIQIIDAFPEQFTLVAFSFGRNVQVAHDILKKHTPKLVCAQTEEDARALQAEYKERGITFVWGESGLTDVATCDGAEVVVTAVMGAVGLLPTLAAIRKGKTIALANKETLVTAGHLVMEEARRCGVSIIPVDSEHSAIYQCLNGEHPRDVSKIILTASGGSFRDRTRDDLTHVTVADALNHPNWSMGAKITIDSATMMNKGLEVIEAHWLFQLPYEQIEVVLHRQSVIHSMVEFKDTSVIAQLGNPDMRVPILYSLTYPRRCEFKQSESLSLAKWGTLTFEEMDFTRFVLLQYAYEAGRIGGSAPSVLNAANEVAVAAFLEGKIPFLGIEDVVKSALFSHEVTHHPSLEEIVLTDEQARQKSAAYIKQRWL